MPWIVRWCFFFTLGVSGLLLAPHACAQGGERDSSRQVSPTVAAAPSQVDSPPTRELRAGWYRWDPYQYQVTKNGVSRLTGLDIELLRAIFAKMGYSLSFDEVTWRQHQADIASGVRDVAGGAFKNPERDVYAYYSDAYRVEKDVIYMRRDDARRYAFDTVDQWLDILKTQQTIRLGVIDGFYYGPRMMAFVEDPANAARIVRVKTDEQNFGNLLTRKVDAIAVDELVGETLVWRNEWQGRVRQVGEPVFSGGIHVLFSKASTSPAVVAAFNQSLKDLRESGEYRQMMREYLLPVMLSVTVGQWWFFVVDIIGTIAFAMSGVLLARQGRYSLFGAMVLAALPSVGGGIVRDVLLQRETLSVLKSPVYLLTILATVLTFYALFRIKRFSEPDAANRGRGDERLIGRLSNHSAVAFFDAVGLAAFTIIGVIVAVDANIQPLWLWGPLIAALTGAGGGILRDVVRADVDNPGLKGSFYAEVALIWGLIFSLALNEYTRLEHLHPGHITAMVLVVLFGALATRMLVFHYKIRSPMF